MSIDAFTLLREGMVEAGSRIVTDLSALPDEKITESPGGKARPAADFVYEVAVVNRRVASRLRGETPPPLPNDGWIVAPEGFRTKATLVSEIQGSMEELLAAYDGHSPDGIEDRVIMGQKEWSVFETAVFIARHMNYHDAQLNYLQAFYGDLEVHW
jgi:hypothetical protein